MKLLSTLLLPTLLLTAVVSLAPRIVVAKNITVPFTPQSPDGVWKQPWQDLCEESSLVMVDQYYRHGKMDKKRAKELLIHIFNVKNTYYGKSLDESTEKIADIANKFLAWEARVVENPTILQIKEQIDLNQPVIIPVSGKDLLNPHFRNGGPRYHVLVISGYDDEKEEFITQEPGTDLGLDFRYTYDTIMGANHDLVSKGDIRQGAKRMVFTTPNLSFSAAFDGDNDGLTKANELTVGTALTDPDTDHDGFSDGTEVNMRFSPFINEKGLPNNSLIKIATDPQVYLLSNKSKRKIASETTFLKNRWQWHTIKVVSQKFIDSLPSGTIIE